MGRHLGRRLASAGHEVHATGRSLTPSLGAETGIRWHVWGGDDSGLASIAAAIDPQVVIHAAADARPSRDTDDLRAQYENTVLPCFAAARTLPTSVEMVAFLGSCEEYGAGPVPAVETQPLHAFSPYGWGKISAYHGARLIAESRSLPWCWLRPYLTFGPHQSEDRLIPHVIRKCLKSEDVPLTEGRQTRDFIHVNDVCGMIHAIVDAPGKACGQVINLCSGMPRTIADVATMIQSMIGRGRLLLGALPYRRGEAMDFYGATATYTALFGAPRLTPFEVAIGETIAWYESAAQA